MLPTALESRVIAGRARNEDAAVVSIPSGKAIVQTVDILTPLVNDPFLFGRIAVANALSDVYALGGEPWCAMNIACFPSSLLEEEGQNTLQEILRGGLDALTESGTTLVGGHTVQDEELKYGLAVTGIIDPSHIAVNDALSPGDLLVLTKPLGTGIVATGVKAEWDNWQQAESELVRWCGRLNLHGARAIREYGLRAATDITGFGLGGHALEMAQASGVCVRVETAALPLFSQAEAYVRDGLIPASSHANREHWGCRTLKEANVSRERESLVFDVQTSGGLLLAVPAVKYDDVKAFLEEAGDLAVCIGEVLAPREDGRMLWLS